MLSYLSLAMVGAMLTVVRCQGPSDPNQVCLMVPPSVEDCYRSYAEKPISDKAAQVVCLQQLLWNFEAQSNFTEDDLAYFRDNFGPGPKVVAYDPKTALPPSGYRKRREYRTLSDAERRRFHSAMDKLYEDGVIERFAVLLQQSGSRHLMGASFLPWFRVYLTMFEEALRKIDRHVFLPYWDSSTDHEMDNPVNSDLWTSKYFGTGTGKVVEGLGAGYVTHQGHLERDYGMRGKLISKDFIRDLLTQCNMKDIAKPTAKRKYDLERRHGGPHVWVGGDMAYPLPSAYDPIFYLHMTYVDYIWELFRVHQRRSCNVNPELDYPDVDIGDSNHPDEPMSGFDWLKNRDGIQDYWMNNWFQYETHPVCPDCCPTCQEPKPMYCNVRKNICVARSRRTNTTTTMPTKEQFYEMHELIALTSTRSPRNRGTPFEYPPNDGRTLMTAYSDATQTKGPTFEDIQVSEKGRSSRGGSAQSGSRGRDTVRGISRSGVSLVSGQHISNQPPRDTSFSTTASRGLGRSTSMRGDWARGGRSFERSRDFRRDSSRGFTSSVGDMDRSFRGGGSTGGAGMPSGRGGSFRGDGFSGSAGMPSGRGGSFRGDGFTGSAGMPSGRGGSFRGDGFQGAGSIPSDRSWTLRGGGFTDSASIPSSRGGPITGGSFTGGASIPSDRSGTFRGGGFQGAGSIPSDRSWTLRRGGFTGGANIPSSRGGSITGGGFTGGASISSGRGRSFRGGGFTGGASIPSSRGGSIRGGGFTGRASNPSGRGGTFSGSGFRGGAIDPGDMRGVFRGGAGIASDRGRAVGGFGQTSSGASASRVDTMAQDRMRGGTTSRGGSIRRDGLVGGRGGFTGDVPRGSSSTRSDSPVRRGESSTRRDRRGRRDFRQQSSQQTDVGPARRPDVASSGSSSSMPDMGSMV